VIEAIQAMGGISAIAISHPHYYSGMVEWSRAFGGPIYLHAADRPASAIERIVKAVEPFDYDRVYGAFWDMVIEADGKAVVKRSAERYLRAIGR
jgi:hypothetical protein